MTTKGDLRIEILTDMLEVGKKIKRYMKEYPDDTCADILKKVYEMIGLSGLGASALWALEEE